VYSGFEMLSHLGSDVEEEYIRSCFVKGEFPGDVWGLKCAVKILACWCPGFAEDLLVAHSENSMSLLFLLSLLSLLFYTLELLVEIILIRLSFYFSSLLELQPSHLSVTSIYTFLYSTNFSV
jgi:hypothetical protein